MNNNYHIIKDDTIEIEGYHIKTGLSIDFSVKPLVSKFETFMSGNRIIEWLHSKVGVN